MQLNNLSYNLGVLPLLFLALWQNGSCGNANTRMKPKEQNRVTAGTWGGQNVSLNVSGSGAEVQFSCAHGSIDQPLVLNSDGRFSAKGTFIAETPGPTYEDNPPKKQPALYSGTVIDQDMTLVVTIIETKDEVGSFTLKQGAGGHVRRCR
jgi:hypothetical protein